MSDLPRTKLSIIRGHMAAGDWDRAIGVASRLPQLGAQRAAILTAQGARTNPAFYRGMGKCPAELIEAGKAALRARFGDV